MPGVCISDVRVLWSLALIRLVCSTAYCNSCTLCPKSSTLFKSYCIYESSRLKADKSGSGVPRNYGPPYSVLIFVESRFFYRFEFGLGNRGEHLPVFAWFF